MSWLLRVESTLYLMQGGTNQYIDKVEIDVDSYDDLKWFVRKTSGWLNSSDAPGTMQIGTVAPSKFAEEDAPKPPGTNEPFVKPVVIQRSSPNKSSREGVKIKRIVLHYTTSRNVEGSLSWFANPESRVSAHYVIAQDGKIYQCVKDSDKAWHCLNNNADTIGIEHSAAKGDKLTPAQQNATAALQSWLLSEYKLPKSAITAHRFVDGQSTDCPGDLWKTEAELKAWVDKNVGVKETEKKSSKVASLTRTGAKYNSGRWSGLEVLELVIGTDVFQVCSGQKSAQNFRKPTDPRSTPGNMEPIPQGNYSIESISFANGKDNYTGEHGPGLGPVWVALTADFSDDRGAFGFHLDSNIDSSPGSAGCVVFQTMTDLKRFVAALRKWDPPKLNVDWGI